MDTGPTTYDTALAEGLFSTATLPPLLATEIDRYEQAILGLLAVRQVLGWPLFSDLSFTAEQRAYCLEGIGDMVHTVRALHSAQTTPQPGHARHNSPDSSDSPCLGVYRGANDGLSVLRDFPRLSTDSIHRCG